MRRDGAQRLGVLVEPIASTANPLVKRAAALRHRKFRLQQRAFLVEGADLVAAGIAAGYTPRVVFVKVDSSATAESPAADLEPVAETAPGDSPAADAEPASKTAPGESPAADAEPASKTAPAESPAADAEPASKTAAVRRLLEAHPESASVELLLEARLKLTVRPVTRRVAERITTLETPPDVMAVFPTLQPPPLAELIAADPLVLYVDRVADPGNLGTLLRAAAAFGATAVATSPESVDPLAPKVVRGSMGALFALPTYERLRLADVMRSLPDCRVYGLAAHGGVDVRDAELRRPAILCIGAERAGLSPPVADRADELLTIPLAAGPGGAVESLNAGVAGAIALYEFSRLPRRIHGEPARRPHD